MKKISAIIIFFILLLAGILQAEEKNEPVVKNFTLDKKNKTFFYELTKPATVRLRVGSKSGPLYKTLVNWQEQKTGKHTIKWDGMDTSKTFDILDSRNFTYSFNFYLAGKDEPVIREYIESDFIISDNFIGRAPTLPHLSQIHKNHKKEYCRDLSILFELPENIEKTKEGFARIKGICPIVINLPEKDKLWFRQERFSVNIFIDDVFVKGEAQGYAPYTWNFNTQGINKGMHLVTVNLKGFNDHMAMGSLPIYVEPIKESRK